MWKETLEIVVCEEIAIKDVIVSASCHYQSYHYGPIIVSKRYDFPSPQEWIPWLPGAPQNGSNAGNDPTLLNPARLTAFFVSNQR